MSMFTDLTPAALAEIRERGYENGARGARAARLSDAAAIDVPRLLKALEAALHMEQLADGELEVKPLATYPLPLGVQYEPAAAGTDGPHGFAVICIANFVVHKEPLHPLSEGDVDRIDLWEAAAEWLARVTGEAAE